MDDGAVTAFYKADRAKVIDVLNEVLATETVCTLRYRSHYFMAKGIHASGVESEFLEHARQEQEHADRVAKRITELGGRPNLDPEGLATRSHARYGGGGPSIMRSAPPAIVRTGEAGPPMCLPVAAHLRTAKAARPLR